MGEAAFRFNYEERFEEGLDERTVPRTSVRVAIDVYSEHNFWSGVTMDVSEGGVFIATQRLVKAGTMLIVDMVLPGDEEPIIALAEVRWWREYTGEADAPPGLGLAFVHVAENSLARIRSFVERIRTPLLFEV